MKTKKLFLSLIALGAGYFYSCFAQNESILIPQTGYLAGANKVAVVRVPADSFMVANATGKIVFRGKLGESKSWKFSNENVQLADFSSIKVPGTYNLLIHGTADKRQFLVSSDPYGGIANAAVKALYFNRCSYPIRTPYGGKWARKAGHPDREVYIHASAVSEGRPEGFVISSPGGWYDAGDYNKYIVNSGISTYTMLLACEMYPEYWKGRNLNIPESGNKLPDILDETLFNLRWMLTMQDNDGGVYHKCTTKQFEGFIMPEDCHEKRYVIQKNTAATLDFAATMAHASVVLGKYATELPGLSDSCRKAALKAWEWCLKNPAILYRQPADIGTGAYGDRNIRDEWFWAGVEISMISGSAFPDSLLSKVQFKTPSWSDVGQLGLITALRNEKRVNPETYAACKKIYFSYADDLVNIGNLAAYPVSINYFVWGSNADVVNQGLLKMVAYSLSGDMKYLCSAVNDMNYITGVNPTGYCFITGIGEKSPLHPHHRPSAADNVPEPVPGFLAGGPNTATFADCPDANRSKLPALSYLDEQCSYSTNEIAINWNTPLVFLAGAISNAGNDMRK
jgi:endoglucanase